MSDPTKPYPIENELYEANKQCRELKRLLKNCRAKNRKLKEMVKWRDEWLDDKKKIIKALHAEIKR